MKMKKEEALKDEEKKDSVKLTNEKKGARAHGNMMWTALFVLLALFAVVFALFLGYCNAM